MTRRVIIVAANNGYRDHAKSLLVNCRRAGKWDGDFAIVCPQDFDRQDLDLRGVCIVRSQEWDWSYAVKFSVFDPFFCQLWDQVLYLDLDCIVQGDLNEACDRQAARFPSILCDGSQYLPGGLGTSIMQDWEHFGRLSGVGPEVKPEAYQRLRERFPFVDEPLLCAGVVFFSPASIPDGTVQKLLAVQAEFREINPTGCDQQVTNLVLHDRLAPLPKDFSCWFAFGDPSNLVASEARDWTGDENPAILHYWGAYAPWLEKTPDAGAYFNHRLGKSCRDVYLENLSAFDENFPRK